MTSTSLSKLKAFWANRPRFREVLWVEQDGACKGCLLLYSSEKPNIFHARKKHWGYKWCSDPGVFGNRIYHCFGFWWFTVVFVQGEKEKPRPSLISKFKQFWDSQPVFRGVVWLRKSNEYVHPCEPWGFKRHWGYRMGYYGGVNGFSDGIYHFYGFWWFAIRWQSLVSCIEEQIQKPQELIG